MTYEQKANEVADAILDYLLVDGENVSASVLNPAREIITTALREAGNAKLEEAAQMFEEKRGRSTWHNAPSIQREIRSLKST